METARKLASYLLQSKAIIINPGTPFKWASGWDSPIYCDNRKTLSYPEIRTFIRDAFISQILSDFDMPDMIAGVATGAIAQAALVAESMKIPMLYVRSSQKAHGLGNQIEGDISVGKKVLVLEDLVSTGGSSLKAVSALQEAGLQVLGMTAIFTYGFPHAEENFQQSGVKLKTLCTYPTLIEEAVETGYIQEEDLQALKNWRIDPAGWKSTSK